MPNLYRYNIHPSFSIYILLNNGAFFNFLELITVPLKDYKFGFMCPQDTVFQF